jgi:hypothetical protein
VSDTPSPRQGEGHAGYSAARPPQGSVPLSVWPRSLAAAFAHVPDPRRHASVTYALAAILTLAVAAILANHLAVLRPLGVPTGRTPCQSLDLAAPVQQA